MNRAREVVKSAIYDNVIVANDGSSISFPGDLHDAVLKSLHDAGLRIVEAGDLEELADSHCDPNPYPWTEEDQALQDRVRAALNGEANGN